MTGPNGFNSDDEQRLRNALRREADQVNPSPDGLERIRARVHRPPWFRRPLALAVAGATATAGVVVAATLVMPSVTSSDDVAGGPSPTVDDTGTPEVTALPVYYAVHRPDGQVRLAREFHHPETTQPIVAAIRDMIRGANDPDYDTLWRPKTAVNSAGVEDNVIVVDLENPALTNAAKGSERAAVQQLVYTATAAASASYAEVKRALPVQILVDGDRPPPKLRAQLRLGNVETRAPELKTRQLVQIDNPEQSTRWPSPITIDGTAAVVEGTLNWVVRKRDGTEVKSGIDTADGCCRFSPFEFKVELPPGTYEVAVSDTDPSEGEGAGVTTDTRAFRVTQ